MLAHWIAAIRVVPEPLQETSSLRDLPVNRAGQGTARQGRARQGRAKQGRAGQQGQERAGESQKGAEREQQRESKAVKAAHNVQCNRCETSGRQAPAFTLLPLGGYTLGSDRAHAECSAN